MYYFFPALYIYLLLVQTGIVIPPLVVKGNPAFKGICPGNLRNSFHHLPEPAFTLHQGSRSGNYPLFELIVQNQQIVIDTLDCWL